MLRWKACANFWPFDPSTKTCPSLIDTLTPAGMAMGCLPMRDMAVPLLPLPDLADDLAAKVLGPGAAVAHDALARGDDADAQTIEDRPELIGAQIEASPRFARSLDVPDDALALRPVLQVDAQQNVRLAEVLLLVPGRMALLIAAGHADVVVADEALVLEHLGDGDLELAGRHIDDLALDAVGVADARQHVRDGIGHHGSVPLTSSP